MNLTGNILKMESSLGEVVDYYLPIGGYKVFLNELIGKELSLKYHKKINCINCGAVTKSSYGQGYCYKCFSTLPETDPAIIRPELDKSHLGISRDMEWAKKNSLINHIVYLSISSGFKVGVTRHTNANTRWIDQGAIKAIKLAITPNRYIAGLIEVQLKNFLPDKTNWRQMLTGEPNIGVELREEKYKVRDYFLEEHLKYFTEDDWVTEIRYPVTKYPEKVKSFSFDKNNFFKGKLTGIKGQYLIFEDETVLNIRKHSGYLIELNA